MNVKRKYTADTHDLERLKDLGCCDLSSHNELFNYQSPIDFSELPKVTKDQSLALTFEYQRQLFEPEIFANAYHLVPTEKKSATFFEGQAYWLIDIHVHFPSEHIFNHEHSEFEFHFVHENAQGDKLVVAMLFNSIADQFIVKDELRRFTIMDEFEAQSTLFVNPGKYLPKEQSFYHFVGSLTTPPYSGPVLWFVMDTIQLANKELVERAKKIVPINNNRLPYPLLDREIFHN